MKEAKSRGILKPALLAILAIVLIVVCWHLIFPLLGVGIVVTLGLWSVIVVSILVICLGVLLLFLLPGILIALVGLFALGWVIFALFLFPFLFPLLAPLLIILFFIAYMVGRRRGSR